MKILRIEKWNKDNNDLWEGEYEKVYYIAKNGNKIYWFDDELNQIKNPLAYKGYDLKVFYKIISKLNNECDSFDADKNTSYDIILYEENIFPYNIYKDFDYENEIIKRCFND